MDPKDTPKPTLPAIYYDAARPVATGLRIGAAIIAAVYGTPLSERTVPTPLPCSRTLQPKGGRS